MSFQDIFKSNFLDSVQSFSLLDTALALVISLALGLFVFFVYKKTFHGVLYSSTFGVSLIGMSMVTTLVILAVTSNVVLSLGMVGALSIVHLRRVAHRHVHGDHARHLSRHVKRRPVARHGRCTVHRPFPCSDQRPS